jgi:hypothetical protein
MDNSGQLGVLFARKMSENDGNFNAPFNRMHRKWPNVRFQINLPPSVKDLRRALF